MDDDTEDTSIGGVTWHCSEEDSGPDVGISVFLGEHERLWCGEISKQCFEEMEGAKHFGGDGGWFIVHYKDRTTRVLIAKCADADDARTFIERVAGWAHEASPPTMAKTLGDMARAEGGS